MKLQLLQSVCITAVSVLIAQPAWADVAQVTDIRLNSTPKGLEVILETPYCKSPQVFTSSFGNTFVVNVLNTQLALPQGRSFRQVNPQDSIASVSVTQQGANSIRVTVTGTSSLPKVAVGRSDRSLTLTLTPASSLRQGVIAPTAQQAQPTPQVPSSAQPDSAQPPATAPQE